MTTPMTRFIFIVTFLAIATSSALLGIQALHVAAEDNLSVGRHVTDVPGNKEVLKILTLNVAHGRKDAFNQILLSKKRIRRNLMDIVETGSQGRPNHRHRHRLGASRFFKKESTATADHRDHRYVVNAQQSNDHPGRFQQRMVCR